MCTRNNSVHAILLSIAAPFFTMASALADDQQFISDLDIFGVLQVDYARVSSEAADYSLDDIEARRGRIGLAGKFAGAGKFKIELDIDTPRDLQLIDAYISYPVSEDLTLKLGQFKTANSLDEQTSSKYVSTLERAAFTDVFGLARGVGASLNHSGKRHTLTFGAFGRDLEDDVLKGYFVAGRATYEPISNDELRLHTGISFRYRDLGDSQSRFRYAQKAIAPTSGRIISAGRIGDSDLFYGVETALMRKQSWAAAELGVLNVQCGTCAADPTLLGGYVEVGQFFGGKRTLKGGQFGRPIVHRSIKDGGPGALSLIAKFDAFDMNSAGVEGGDYRSLTLGADWWPTTHTRLGVNVYKIDVDFGSITSGLAPEFATAIAAGVQTEDATGLTIRAQFDF